MLGHRKGEYIVAHALPRAEVRMDALGSAHLPGRGSVVTVTQLGWGGTYLFGAPDTEIGAYLPTYSERPPPWAPVVRAPLPFFSPFSPWSTPGHGASAARARLVEPLVSLAAAARGPWGRCHCAHDARGRAELAATRGSLIWK